VTFIQFLYFPEPAIEARVKGQSEVFFTAPTLLRQTMLFFSARFFLKHLTKILRTTQASPFQDLVRLSDFLSGQRAAGSGPGAQSLLHHHHLYFSCYTFKIKASI
jgi:hypothetical protein